VVARPELGVGNMKRTWQILVVVTVLVIATIVGAFVYERGKSKNSVADAQARLDASQKATTDLDQIIQAARRDEKLASLELELSRMKEDEARKAGDAAKQRQLAEETRKREEEAKQAAARTKNLEAVRVAPVPVAPLPKTTSVVAETKAPEPVASAPKPQAPVVVASVAPQKHQAEGFDGDWKGEWACGEQKFEGVSGANKGPQRSTLVLSVKDGQASSHWEDAPNANEFAGSVSGSNLTLKGRGHRMDNPMSRWQLEASGTFSANSFTGKGIVKASDLVMRDCTLSLTRN